MGKETILAALRFRHACKEFDPKRQVAEEDFAYILEAGRLSPSSFGFEPWKFVVLQNAELRERLLPVTWGGQRSIPTASHLVLLLSRTKSSFLPDSEYVAYMMKEVKKLPADLFPGFQQRLFAFLSSDFKLLDNERAVFEWSSRQTYIALGNMMTAAAAIGIDSCPIEGFDKDAAESLLREVGILDDQGTFGLSCMAAFGYRLNEPRPKARRAIEEVVQWVR